MTGPTNPRLRIKKDWLAVTAVILAPVIYFYPVLRVHGILCPDDGVLQNVPLRATIASIIRAGHLPLWNPHIFSGMPLFAAAQGGVLFPLNWFYLIFSAPTATNLDVLSTYALAGVGAYVYARRARINISGALTTSFVWQFCGFMVAHIGHINALQTVALLPWLLWSIDLYSERGRRLHGMLIAMIVALQVFAGHQQTLAYALLLAIAYAIAMSFTVARPARSRYLASIILLAVGLSLAAVQILPTVELARNSVRASATYDFFTSFSLPPRLALMLVAPYFAGGGDGRLFKALYVGPEFYGEYIGYVGLLALILAVIGLRFRFDARAKFWGAISLIALLLSLGRFLPFDLFRILYYIPILDLFRVPARHLMEFDLALAVLAGRGVTSLCDAQERRALTSWSLLTGFVVLLLALLTVTVWRPAEFHLWQDAPVTIMRAPELFLPVLLALLSLVVIWLCARGPRPRLLLVMLAVLLLDLALWGQFSGWRVMSPLRGSAYWSQPVGLKFLPQSHDHELSRIMTLPHPIDPNERQGEIGTSTEFAPSLLPDFYMMHRLQNAAGYDGFGLARYSALADDMKVWGDLPEPRESLAGESRAIDLLGVRYLFVRNPKREPVARFKRPPAESMTNIGGYLFAAEALSVSDLKNGERLTFDTPRFHTDHFALITNLTWSTEIPDGTAVARIQLNAEDGRAFEFYLRAGQDTADWAHERADLQPQMKHRLPPIATSYKTEDAQSGNFVGHAYLASFTLPERTALVGGEIDLLAVPNAPQLGLSVQRVSLVDQTDGYTLGLQRDWIRKENLAAPDLQNKVTSDASVADRVNAENLHWKKLGETNVIVAYENQRALPRAWLASETRVISGEEILRVIRSGKFPDGSAWDPKRTALIEAPIDLPQFQITDENAHADIVTYEPNRVEIKTSSSAAGVLVLSDNHYPGWRTYVDGHAAETLRVDYNLRGVPLTPGQHQVVFVYRPKSVVIGLIVSLLTLLAITVWVSRRRKAE